ncbi:MAG: 4Fe-4S dicluster domain-containing protein [Nitrospirota bacterium]|nr:MAG: 4Fe-4S dicluster domain-containing protein [Nitrospirota bacterium]
MKDIDLSTANPEFRKDIAQKIGLEKIDPCYQCGSCTGVCPVREVVEDFDPRRLIHMVVLGMRQEVLSSDLIWFCCLCNSCYAVCPQGIRFSRIAAELQKLAVDEGYVKQDFLDEFVKINGYLKDLCRRTMFNKVRAGFYGSHKMPCWQKHTKKKV